jgi:hypothetical protein
MALRSARMVSVLSLMVGCLICASIAHADTEPNDSLVEAEPLSSSTMGGEVTLGNEEDWYSAYLGAQQQVTLTVELADPSVCSDFLDFTLRDETGEQVEELEPDAGSNFEPTTSAGYSFTTPSRASTYYVQVRWGIGRLEHACPYRLSVSPGSAFAGAPPARQIVTVPEPDEFPAQAFGPLRASVLYRGAKETTNDSDDLWLDVRPGRRAWAKFGVYGCFNYADATVIKQTDLEFVENGGYFTPDTGSAAPNQWAQVFSFDGEESGEKWYVEIGADEVGCKWQLEVGPASALMTPRHHSATPAHTCGDAKRSLARLGVRLRRAERTLPFVHDPEARRRLTHKIDSRHRAIRVAKGEVKKLCG